MNSYCTNSTSQPVTLYVESLTEPRLLFIPQNIVTSSRTMNILTVIFYAALSSLLQDIFILGNNSHHYRIQHSCMRS